ncbi:MAG: hypothetical protein ACREFY_03555 [Acetobacteraceae bacterium]
MFGFSTVGQFPIGIAIGIASALAPSLMRSLLIIALALLAVQGGILYAAGGPSALANFLHWLLALGASLVFVLSGVGVGRLGADMLIGRG